MVQKVKPVNACACVLWPPFRDLDINFSYGVINNFISLVLFSTISSNSQTFAALMNICRYGSHQIHEVRKDYRQALLFQSQTCILVDCTVNPVRLVSFYCYYRKTCMCFHNKYSMAKYNFLIGFWGKSKTKRTDYYDTILYLLHQENKNILSLT